MTWLFSFINQHNFKLVRKDIDGVSYTWISLNKIRTELPLLGRISKSTLSRDVTNLVRFGYIKKYIDEDKKLFIALTELYDEIRAEKEEACKEAEKEKFG
jgi:DNA-binding MarR family transcriptional regulator